MRRSRFTEFRRMLFTEEVFGSHPEASRAALLVFRAQQALRQLS